MSHTIPKSKTPPIAFATSVPNIIIQTTLRGGSGGGVSIV
jgi:hypothetical protein